MANNKPTIFVQIASYRDRECQWTVKDLFEKATHPERVFVGLAWQYDRKNGTDAECFQVPYPYPEQVRIVEFDHHESRGANWGRVQASKLLRDEDYVFISEPHCRYEPGWDETLIESLALCENDKAILSGAMPEYFLPNELSEPYLASLSIKTFFTNDVVLINTHRVPPGFEPEKPFPMNVLVVSCLFAKADLIRQVLQDPYIYFEGDESSYSARVWTHGWDIYCMHKPVAYHLWDRSKRPVHGYDHPQKLNKLSELSAERFRYLMGMVDTASKEALVDFEKYGMGTVRSLKEYEKFAKIDFKNKIIHDQSEWVIANTDGATERKDISHRMQLWQIKRHMDWLRECYKENVDVEHIISICAESGIDREITIDQYEKAKVMFARLDRMQNSIKDKNRLPAETEEWVKQEIMKGRTPGDVFSSLVNSGWELENTVNSVAYVIYDLPFFVMRRYCNKDHLMQEFADFLATLKKPDA